MPLKPVHNVVIAITPPDDRPQTIVSLTVPEPGALRLTEAIAGVQHTVFPGEIVRMLADGFHQCDAIAANKPDVEGPAGNGKSFADAMREQAESFYRLIDDLWQGRKHIGTHSETGAMVINEGPKPDSNAGVPSDLLEDLADGKVRIIRGANGDPVIDDMPESRVDEVDDPAEDAKDPLPLGTALPADDDGAPGAVDPSNEDAVASEKPSKASGKRKS